MTFQILFAVLAISDVSGAVRSSRVGSPLSVDLPRIGTLAPKSTREIANPSWTLGCETLDRDFADFKAYRDYLPPLGIKRIRLQAGWAKCERERGKFDFGWLDEIVDFARTNAIEVLMDLSYGNPIYPGGGGWDLAAGIPTSEEGLSAWDLWTETIARHFRDRVAWWAMWNEPDIGAENTPERIAAFNVRTAKTLRKVLPGCRIAGLSLASNAPDLMEECLKPMGSDVWLFDAFIYHGYQLAPEASYDRVSKLKEVIARYAPHAFLWQCENGAPSEMCGKFALAFTPWSELTQAKWNLRRMLGDRGHDIASSVFTICDFNHKGREINRKGLLRANENHEVIAIKRAYYAVQNLVSVFDGTERRISKPHVMTSDTTLVLDEYEMADGSPLLAFWSFAEEGEKDASCQNGGEAHRMLRPSDSFVTRPAVFRWNGSAFEDPVWVDALTGWVYGFPRESMIVHSCGIELVNVPVYDSPAFLTERKALKLRLD